MKHCVQTIFLLFSIILLTNCKNKNENRDIYFDGEYPPFENITITENGKDYAIPAISGQCIVFFKDEVSQPQAKAIIEKNGGKIIEQMPDFNYYLTLVKEGKENTFLSRMREEKHVEYVFLNSINKGNSEVYVLDNFKDVEPKLLTTHGNAVVATFSKYSGALSHVHGVNREIMNDVQAETKLGQYWEAIKVIATANSLCTDLMNSVSNTKNGDITMINMSFGVGLSDKEERFLFEDASKEEQDNYIMNYAKSLENLSVCFEKMRKKGYSNFIVSKSSGNEGMYQMELILNELDENTLQSLRNHLILVNAYDAKENTLYSNNVKKKNTLSTTIDVTPELWSGTSFAAPKLLGFVDRVISKYKSLKAQDIITAIRNATPSDTKLPMTYEMLEKEAAKLAETRKQCKQYTFTLNMTSDYKGEWDLSDGKGQEIVKYHVHDTYSYEYLSGNKMAIDIDNTTNYDLEILLEVLDPDKEVRSLRYMLEKGQKESFYAQRLDLFGDSDHISVRETQVTIITW